MRSSILPWFLVGMVAVAAACSSSTRTGTFAQPTGDGGTSGSGGNSDNSSGDNTGDIINNAPSGDAGPAVGACVPDPANFEAPGNGCDDDGDGTVDNVAPACDTSLAVDGDATQFAKAIGLCPKSSSSGWGLVSAKYLAGYNSDREPEAGQHGILTKFGSVLKPREGASLGVLSSGYAREYDTLGNGTTAFKKGTILQSSFQDALDPGAVPPGFPKSANGCPAVPIANDIAVVHLEIKVPKNAQGIQFDFNFMSGEWPEWVCTPFNDSFIAYLKSSGFNSGAADNISFDSKGGPVSVNNGFFDRCTPNSPTGCQASPDNPPTGTAACPGGESELAGTGFLDKGTYCGTAQTVGGGATGWLTSQAPVTPGETITLEFYVWDGTDGNLDSSVLIDNLQWLPTPVSVATTTRPK